MTPVTPVTSMTPTVVYEPMTRSGHSPPAPERPHLVIGFVPLTDAAPLIIAKELGFFEQFGLEVTLTREESWASIRDKLAADVIDAAHMLAAMPLAMTLGLTGIHKPTITALQLSLNGNAITLSEPIAKEIEQTLPAESRALPLSSTALKPVVERFRREGNRLTLGSVFPYSSHNYELRTWLLDGGIDPNRDVDIIIVPPPQMVDRLQDGTLHGFCVGEPWNSLAAQLGIGRIVAAKHQLWPDSLEKVLGVTEQWADNHPSTHLALIAALYKACHWLDIPANRPAAAGLLSSAHYVHAPQSVITQTLAPEPPDTTHNANETHNNPSDYFTFHNNQANRPCHRQAALTLSQIVRHSQSNPPLPPFDREQLLNRVFRADLFDKMLKTHNTALAIAPLRSPAKP